MAISFRRARDKYPIRSETVYKTDMANIEMLSTDRELITPEIHIANDFYGHAVNLKRFLGLHPEYPLKVMIEHGPHLRDYMWDYELQSRLPVYLCANDYYANAFQRATGKTAIPIGPQLAYVKDENRRKEYPNERVLLVFPYHSTHHIENRTNNDEFLAAVESYGRDFDRIRICLYWRNIQLGDHRFYTQRGHECVTAGHIYDPRFLMRFKNILESSTAVVSANAGTEVIYSIFIKKPVWIIYQKPQSHAKTAEFRKQAEDVQTCDLTPFLNVVNAFSEPRSDISDEQYLLIQKLGGFKNVKTKSELLDIMKNAEDEYSGQRLRCHPVVI